MLNSPKVSFVMPAFKRAFLKEAMQSILSQNFTNFELIIVNDCSPENLEEIVFSFSDPRIHYTKNEENIGCNDPVKNWNLACSKAKGEYCVLASDDDIYAPEYLHRMLELMIKYPHVDLVHCRIGMINAKGELLRLSEKRPEFESCPDLIYNRAIRRCLQTAPEFMFRRTALEEKGGFVDFPLAWYSDDATWSSLAKKNGIAYSSEVLFYWRYSGLNISSRFDRTALKIAAAEQFKEWIKLFLSTLSAQDAEESLIVKQCQNNITQAIDKQSIFDLNDTAFIAWMKLLFSGKVKSRLLLRSLRDRCLKLCHH